MPVDTQAVSELVAMFSGDVAGVVPLIFTELHAECHGVERKTRSSVMTGGGVSRTTWPHG
ncbi:MAG: hypothetical protein J07HX5_01227 [halophilic archaeon J07HX5]|nr:MAG: hypothetical protein J07HX5_01227 [halophilic archaeon J07HX5]